MARRDRGQRRGGAEPAIRPAEASPVVPLSSEPEPVIDLATDPDPMPDHEPSPAEPIEPVEAVDVMVEPSRAIAPIAPTLPEPLPTEPERHPIIPRGYVLATVHGRVCGWGYTRDGDHLQDWEPGAEGYFPAADVDGCPVLTRV